MRQGAWMVNSLTEIWTQAGLYGVYAEVAQFRDWIDSTIAAGGGATFCKNGA
jgi:secreted trypsin-like serine protease